MMILGSSLKDVLRNLHFLFAMFKQLLIGLIDFKINLLGSNKRINLLPHHIILLPMLFELHLISLFAVYGHLLSDAQP
jgi:hypothetical protein